MDSENKESLLQQLREAFSNRKYFLISAAVTFALMLGALVTASRHLNNVRRQAADPRRRVPGRLRLIMANQNNLDALMQSLPHMSHGNMPAHVNKAVSLSCQHPDCLWVDQFVSARRDLQVDPCGDFYSYACSTNWSSATLPSNGASYRRRTVGQTLLNLHSYFNATIKRSYSQDLEGRFLHQVSNLFLDCLIEYKGRNERESLVGLSRDFKLYDSKSEENLTALIATLDRELRLFPFVTVTVMPDTYKLIMTPSSTILKRYHLAFSSGEDEDYIRIIARALALIKPDSDVFPKPLDLSHRISAVINTTEVNTLVDYLRYRFLIFVAPFLSEDFSFLLPLGYNSHQDNVPERHQACARSVEGVYRYGMRFLVSEANQHSLQPDLWKEEQKAFKELLKLCKYVLKDHISNRTLMMSPEMERIFLKLDAMQVSTEYVFESELSSIIHYYSRMAVPLKSSSPLQTYLTLQQSSSELYWSTGDQSLDHDVRFLASSLVPGYEYRENKNTLYITPATFGFLGKGNIVPIFVIPAVLQYVIQGILSPIFAATPPSEFRRPRDTTKILTESRLCLFEQYYAGMTDIFKEDVALDSDLTNFVEFNTMVSILYDVFQVYKNLTAALTTHVSGVEDNTTGVALDQLFLTTWAATHCEPTNDNRERRLIRFMEVPPRLKVDISLQNFARFGHVFSCPVASPMSPSIRCAMV
ncbi:hypothetical protein HPB47_002863 [Ixodes persulcatus]|uniref:Uncharacterized protein n=1 Tax=Ixodes persulcatus TaxID=34615 RepID=A0AC60PLP7_IXOPE|nr:hypothetical protein HPB47_002863 [Ixodes persulcatus]